jgi:2-iminobutanoate/2-iminopropanoate deaminase
MALTRNNVPSPTPGLDMNLQFGWQQSCATHAGDYVFVSGVVAINPETGERMLGTVTEEAHRVFKNLKMILESAGSSLDRLVAVHAGIYDRIEYDVLNRVYRQYVPNGPPARTVWSIQIIDGFKVQIDAVAVV